MQVGLFETTTQHKRNQKPSSQGNAVLLPGVHKPDTRAQFAVKDSWRHAVKTAGAQGQEDKIKNRQRDETVTTEIWFSIFKNKRGAVQIRKAFEACLWFGAM